MKIVVQQCHLMNGLTLIFITKMIMIVIVVVIVRINTTLVVMIMTVAKPTT